MRFGADPYYATNGVRLEADLWEALGFDRFDVLEEEEDKKNVLDIHISLLNERSLAEVKLVQRMVRDMFDTLDQEKIEG